MGTNVFDEAALSAWCVAFVADMLDRAPGDIDPTHKFSRIGFDSAMSVQLVVALEERLDMDLSPDVIGDHPTIAKLAAHLASLRADVP